MWLVWITQHDGPVAVVTSEDDAKLLVRALSAYDSLVGAEMAAWYTPASDPTDQRYMDVPFDPPVPVEVKIAKTGTAGQVWQYSAEQIRALPDGDHQMMVRMVRLSYPRPRVEYVGLRTIAISRYISRWRNHQEVERISIVAMDDEGENTDGWAEYDDTMAEDNGDLVAEDYLLQLFGPGGTGRTLAEINTGS